ncbi:hypothetical protein OROHE_013842 [Orobanche hederae]
MLEESVSAIPSSIWASMTSWFTPTVLFILLNLMIATIAFTSSLSRGNPSHQPLNHDKNSISDHNHLHKQNNNATNSPTSLLHRLQSINFRTHFRSQEETPSSSVNHEPNPDSDTRENPDTGTADSQAQARENINLRKNGAHFDLKGKDSDGDDFQQAREERVVGEDSGGRGMDGVYSRMRDGHDHFSRSKSDTETASGELPARLSVVMRKSASSKSAFGRFEEEEVVEARRPATVREKGNAKVTEGDEEVDAKADDFINRFKQQLKLQRLDSIIRYKEVIGKATGAGED